VCLPQEIRIALKKVGRAFRGNAQFKIGKLAVETIKERYTHASTVSCSEMYFANCCAGDGHTTVMVFILSSCFLLLAACGFSTRDIGDRFGVTLPHLVVFNKGEESESWVRHDGKPSDAEGIKASGLSSFFLRVCVFFSFFFSAVLL